MWKSRNLGVRIKRNKLQYTSCYFLILKDEGIVSVSVNLGGEEEEEGGAG